MVGTRKASTRKLPDTRARAGERVAHEHLVDSLLGVLGHGPGRFADPEAVPRERSADGQAGTDADFEQIAIARLGEAREAGDERLVLVAHAFELGEASALVVLGQLARAAGASSQNALTCSFSSCAVVIASVPSTPSTLAPHVRRPVHPTARAHVRPCLAPRAHDAPHATSSPCPCRRACSCRGPR